MRSFRLTETIPSQSIAACSELQWSFSQTVNMSDAPYPKHFEASAPAQAPPSYSPQQQQVPYQPVYPQIQQAGPGMITMTGQPMTQQPGPQVFQQIPVQAQFGSVSQRMTCPSCGASVLTKVDQVSTAKTHLIAAAICFPTLFFCCCCLGLIPYCE